MENKKKILSQIELLKNKNKILTVEINELQSRLPLTEESNKRTTGNFEEIEKNKEIILSLEKSLN